MFIGATIETAPLSITNADSKNLVNNLNIRSSVWNKSPLISALYEERATFKTCFVTTKVELEALGHLFVLGFDLNKVAMQNAILITTDTDEALIYNPYAILANFNVYVGYE